MSLVQVEKRREFLDQTIEFKDATEAITWIDTMEEHDNLVMMEVWAKLNQQFPLTVLQKVVMESIEALLVEATAYRERINEDYMKIGTYKERKEHYEGKMKPKLEWLNGEIHRLQQALEQGVKVLPYESWADEFIYEKMMKRGFRRVVLDETRWNRTFVI